MCKNFKLPGRFDGAATSGVVTSGVTFTFLGATAFLLLVVVFLLLTMLLSLNVKNFFSVINLLNAEFV
jgi:hypothetical protein